MFDKLKQVLLNLKNNIVGGVKKTANDVVQKYTPFANPETNKGQSNFWSQDNSGKMTNPIARGLTMGQEFFANNKKVSIPKTDLTLSFDKPVPEFTIQPENTLKTKVLKTVANLPGMGVNPVTSFVARTGQDIGQTFADNAHMLTKTGAPELNYQTAKSGATRLLMQGASKLDKTGQFQKATNTKIGVKEVLGNLADPAEFAFNLAMMGKGKEAKDIVKGVIDVATKKGFKETMLQGIKEGAKIGGVFGGLEALQSGRTEQNNVKYVLDMTKQIAGGATGGAVLGGLATAIPAALGTIESAIKKIRPKISAKETSKAAEVFLRDEAGRFVGRTPKNKDIVFYGDLRESLGLPRDGSNIPQLGNSIRKLTPEEHAINPANKMKKGWGDNNLTDEFFNPSASGKVAKAKVVPPKETVYKTTGKESFFHGTKNAEAIAKEGFNLNNPGQNSGYKGTMGEGIYMAPDKGYAELYGTPLEVKAKPGLKLFKWSGGLEDFYNSQTKYGDPTEITKLMKSKGYDGIKIGEEGNPGTQLVIFDPANVIPQTKKVAKEMANAVTTLKTPGPKPAEQIVAETIQGKKPTKAAPISTDEMFSEADVEKMTKEFYKQNASAGNEFDQVAQKMKDYIQKHGEEKNAEGLLNREHIPADVFGISSDEVATAMGKDEAAFMSELTDSLKGNIGGKPLRAKDLKAMGFTKTKADKPFKPVKTLKDTLPPNIQAKNTWDNQMAFASAQRATTPKDLKIAQQAQERTAKLDFNEWRRVLNEQEGLLTPKQLENKNMKTVTGALKKSKSAVSDPSVMKDLSGFMGQARDVYRNFKAVYGDKFETAKKMILDPFDNAKGKFIDDQVAWADDLDKNIVKGLGIKKGSAESAAVQDFGEGNRDMASLVRDFGQEKADKIVKADQWFRSQYDNLLEEVNKARAIIYPNNPEKQIPRRQDYYRHFTEMANGFQGLKNIFENPSGISSKLSGISPGTKPKSKWLSFAQKRLGVKTDVDAVGGFLNYIQSAAYAKNIDPQISNFRNLATELADATAPESANAGKVNNFIEYLNDFANDLSGKTNEGDRWFQKVIPGGRTAFKAINWLNNRVKANTILGNVSSSLAQISNVPQGIADAGLKNSVPAFGDTLAGIFKENPQMAKSTFLKERFFNGYDKFDTSMIDKTKNFAAWMVGALDEVGSRFIWNAEYRKALEIGAKDAVKFADDATRSLVAGRGVGEVPLIQKSKVFQLVAPFQLEVGNLWYVMKDWIDAKQFGKLATFAVASYVLNKGLEATRGSGTTLDPIQAMVDAFKAYQGEDNKAMGALKAGGRLAGEVVSNMPLGQTVAGLYPEYGTKIGDTQLPTRKEFFGRNDPTRFGSGLVATGGLMDPLYKILPPFGGGQIKKTLSGIKTVAQGFKESASGKVTDVVDKNVGNLMKGAFFGPGAVKGVNAQGDEPGATFGDKQSQVIKNAGNKMKEVAKTFVDKRAENAALDKAREQVKKTTGSVQSVGNNIVYNDGGEVKTIYIDKVTSMPTTNRFEKAKKTSAAYQMVDDVMKITDMSDADKEDIVVNKLGLDPKEVSYYLVANTNAAERHAFIQDALGQAETNGIDKYDILIGMRKYVNSKRILSDDVIDDLVDDGSLTTEEGKQFKKIKFDENGNLKKTTGTGITPAKLKTYKKNVASAQEKYYRARAKSMQMPELDTTFFKASSPAKTNTLRSRKQTSSGSVQLSRPTVRSIPVEQLFQAPNAALNISKARQLVTGGGYSPTASGLKLSKSSYRSG